MKKNIHFICSGNVFRSRLAESYLNSLGLKNIEAISSGTHADLDTNGPIGWYAARLIKKYSLVTFLKPFWNQTTQKNINDSHILIFMTKDNFLETKKIYNLKNKNYEIWDIYDLSDFGFKSDFMTNEKEIDSINISEEIFLNIKDKVNNLIKNL